MTLKLCIQDNDWRAAHENTDSRAVHDNADSRAAGSLACSTRILTHVQYTKSDSCASYQRATHDILLACSTRNIPRVHYMNSTREQLIHVTRMC